MSTFVFFHVGEDITFPLKMVQSLKAVMPDAEVIMCTDEVTPKVEGVSRTFISKGNYEQIMYWRTAAFASLRLNKTAMYIDTDMLFVLPVDPAEILAERDIIFCRRSFHRDATFNGNQMGGTFKKYDGIPLATLYPYLGCATITKNYHSWKCLAILMSLMDNDLKRWYGDQEALKVYSHMVLPELMGEMEESDYACLPDLREESHVPRILHYKGPGRKQAFLDA